MGDEDYLWDRRGEPDPAVVHLEQVMGRLRAAEPRALLSLTAMATDAAVWRPRDPQAVPYASPLEQTATGAAKRLTARGAEVATRELSLFGGNPTDAPDALKGHAANRWFVLPFAAAATLAVAAASVWLSFHPPGPRPAWEVARLAGTPRIASRAIAANEATGRLPVGEWLETDAEARARIRVAHIGQVEVEPGTRVGLIHTGRGDYRLRLDRGTLHALIWARPGQFFIETPAATAIDLGCAYTLQADGEGETVVQVTSGWVALRGDASRTATRRDASGRVEKEGHAAAAAPRVSIVKSGWTSIARRDGGPGTPYRNDASAAFKAALRTLDWGDTPESRDPAAASGTTKEEGRAAAFDIVVAEAGAADAITLWHLLPRVAPSERDRVFDRLAALVPPPNGVTRDTVRHGSRDALDRWWAAARLGPSFRIW